MLFGDDALDHTSSLPVLEHPYVFDLEICVQFPPHRLQTAASQLERVRKVRYFSLPRKSDHITLSIEADGLSEPGHDILLDAGLLLLDAKRLEIRKFLNSSVVVEEPNVETGPQTTKPNFVAMATGLPGGPRTTSGSKTCQRWSCPMRIPISSSKPGMSMSAKVKSRRYR
jgi:hypothetical protein